MLSVKNNKASLSLSLLLSYSQILISAFVVCFQDNVVANAHAKIVECLDLQCKTFQKFKAFLILIS